MLKVILPHVILYYALFPLVVCAIAEKWLPFLFFHPLMASGPFHCCTYVEVGSHNVGSYLSLYRLGLRALSGCLQTIHSPVGRSFSFESGRQLASGRWAWEGRVKAEEANCFSLRAGTNSVLVLV